MHMAASRPNILDRAIGFFNPAAALRRAESRRALAFYEGARPSKHRTAHMGNASPDALVNQGAAALRAHARAHGALGLREDGLRHLASGLTAAEELLRATRD